MSIVSKSHHKPSTRHAYFSFFFFYSFLRPETYSSPYLSPYSSTIHRQNSSHFIAHSFNLCAFIPLPSDACCILLFHCASVSSSKADHRMLFSAREPSPPSPRLSQPWSACQKSCVAPAVSCPSIPGSSLLSAQGTPLARRAGRGLCGTQKCQLM